MSDPVSESLYDVDSSDPRGELVDRSGMDPEDVAQIARLMKAHVELRDAERRMSDSAQKYMSLGKQEMRALHYLIVAGNRDAIATPGSLAAHLGISSASTTKLLNRLERGRHIARQVHPTDRRAFAITITPDTKRAAVETVGRHQSKRFAAAARLSREEREIVIRYLTDMARELSLDGDIGDDRSDGGAP
ncbi:MarR family winged helix-turn-helix transcriptional regulator [Leucobacter weissii]|uniref:MarR family winged helix-turn-helix transcriptional regulator n=1 Tax=Leucobacter weissii TaxID=1983706 RepID=UPI003132B649